ncbi:hypothetical protein VP02_18900 [Pseudomonas ogarae]|uniref:Uncharacterized protein n=1 Tax=Pseudomonas kilonensis TaxID=132476 RepID=A0A0F4XKA2_9PSED|nr:hypothetical protein [Pseudomonas ogarae]KKA06220.1 hypothetical protein VP02_18900 [Pseudomonas ogarae]
MISLYVGFPATCFIGNDGVDAAVECLKVEFPDVRIKHVVYDARCSLSILDFCSMVGQRPGPVLLLEPIQSKVLEEVRLRLALKLPVACEMIVCEEELCAAVDTILGQFKSGEPMVPLDLAVALLVLAKLEDGHMWGGNAKGYMWAADIPKGRGVDEKYKDRVPYVLNILLQHSFLISKPSKGKSKFALNPSLKPDIYEALRLRSFPEKTGRLFLRHQQLESVRVLDDLPEYAAGRM